MVVVLLRERSGSGSGYWFSRFSFAGSLLAVFLVLLHFHLSVATEATSLISSLFVACLVVSSLEVSITGVSTGSQRSLTLSVHDDEHDEKPKLVSITRLVYVNKPELPILLFRSVASVILGMVTPILGLLLSKAITMYQEPPEEMRKDSKFWAIVCVGIGLITFVALSLRSYLFGIAGAKLIERIRSMTIFEKVACQEISWFDDLANSRNNVNTQKVNAFAFAVVQVVQGYQPMLQQLGVLLEIIENISSIVTALIEAFAANWMLSLIIIAISPLFSIQGCILAKFAQGFRKRLAAW
uniref:ABC transmembrane type-1 domain-containing protein n=1 Tax=Populus trichocarpa TaxID=3694 RepID=A0A2K1ZY94_POPTR